MTDFKHSFSLGSAGSPYSSNVHPGLMRPHSESQQMQSTGSGGAAYLPNFLLGGASPAGNPYSRSTSTAGYQGVSPPSHSQHSFSSPHLQSTEKRPSHTRVSPLLHGSLGDKGSNAPPVAGLYDNARGGVDEINTNSGWGSTPSRAGMSFSGANVSVTPGNTTQLDNSMNNSVFSPRDSILQSPAQMDPFYTQGESLGSGDILDETWVTIFGFPPSLVAYILEQFSQYGTIEKKEIANNVNWIHIKYQTKLQAKKALSKNGKILNGNIMVGVCQCIDKEVMNGNQQDMTCYKSILGTPSSNTVKSPNTKPSSIRPLTAAYQAAANQNKVIQEGKGTPQRNNSLVSKTLEYVFGW